MIERIKNIKLWKKLTVSVIVACLSLAGIITGVVFSAKNLGSIISTDTSSFVSVGNPLYSASTKAFDDASVQKLLNCLLGGSKDVTYGEAARAGNTNQSAADIRGKVFKKPDTTVGQKKGNQDIVLSLGGLTWTVVYLTKSTQGDAILTLWLSNSVQDSWKSRSQTEGPHHGYIDGALYAMFREEWVNSKTNDYPNLYATSYIRSNVLNNSPANSRYWSRLGGTKTTQDSTSAFAPFTMSNSSTYAGLSKYIVAPQYVSYQSTEALRSLPGRSFDTNVWYNCPNDAYSTSISNSGFKSAAFNYAQTANLGVTCDPPLTQNAWMYDAVWLPSITETGFNATSQNYYPSTAGIWQLSLAQLKNYSGATFQVNKSVGSLQNDANVLNNYTVLRSGYSGGNLPTGQPQAQSVQHNFLYYLTAGGSTNNGSTVNAITNPLSIRPAIHLNLTDVLANVSSTVSLNKDGGSGGDLTVTAVGRNWPKVTTPTKSGYTFGGYFTEKNGGGVKYYNADGTANLTSFNDRPIDTPTLYAAWEGKSVTITLNKVGGSGGSSSVTAKVGIIMPEITVPTRGGYKFMGYYTTSTGGGTQYYDASGKGLIACPSSPPTTLYAYWKSMILITLNRGAGTGGTASFYAYPGDPFPVITPPTCEGYVFNGYFTSPSGGTKYYTSNGYPVIAICPSYNTTPTTLYAQYSRETWLMHAATSFDGGSGSRENPYRIRTPAQLAYLSKQVNNGSAYSNKFFIQTANIDLQQYYWEPIGNFDDLDYPSLFGGIFDGNGYKIKNMNIESEKNYQGLFGVLGSAEIDHVYIEGGSINTTGDVAGGIAGGSTRSNEDHDASINWSTVSNLKITANDCVGGLIGMSLSGFDATLNVVTDCTLEAKATNGTIGGAIGYADGDAPMMYDETDTPRSYSTSIFGCIVENTQIICREGLPAGFVGFASGRTDVMSCAGISVSFIFQSANGYFAFIGAVADDSFSKYVLNSFLYTTSISSRLAPGQGTKDTCWWYAEGGTKWYTSSSMWDTSWGLVDGITLLGIPGVFPLQRSLFALAAGSPTTNMMSFFSANNWVTSYAS